VQKASGRGARQNRDMPPPSGRSDAVAVSAGAATGAPKPARRAARLEKARAAPGAYKVGLVLTAPATTPDSMPQWFWPRKILKVPAIIIAVTSWSGALASMTRKSPPYDARDDGSKAATLQRSARPDARGPKRTAVAPVFIPAVGHEPAARWGVSACGPGQQARPAAGRGGLPCARQGAAASTSSELARRGGKEGREESSAEGRRAPVLDSAFNAPAHDLDGVPAELRARGVLIDTRLVCEEVLVDGEGALDGPVEHDLLLDVGCRHGVDRRAVVARPALFRAVALGRGLRGAAWRVMGGVDVVLARREGC